MQIGLGRKISPQPRQHFVDRLWQALCVTRGTAQTYQEPKMSGDTVPDLAEKGQINKQPLLQQRRQRIVQVRELSESPQILCNLRIVRREAEEVWQNAKSFGNPGFQLALRLRHAFPS